MPKLAKHAPNKEAKPQEKNPTNEEIAEAQKQRPPAGKDQQTAGGRTVIRGTAGDYSTHLDQKCNCNDCNVFS